MSQRPTATARLAPTIAPTIGPTSAPTTDPTEGHDRMVTDEGACGCLLTWRERWILSIAILVASTTITIGERLPTRTSRRVPFTKRTGVRSS